MELKAEKRQIKVDFTKKKSVCLFIPNDFFKNTLRQGKPSAWCLCPQTLVELNR